MTIIKTLMFASLAFAIDIGAQAPKVSGVDEKGATLNFETLYEKNKYTLVFFFPKAGTSGCTAQACSLRDQFNELTKKGIAVVGVSTDNLDAQRAFSQMNKFQFPLVADNDKKVVKAFGVPTTFGFAKRQAFLISGGKVVWLDKNASTDKQAKDVLEAVAKLESAISKKP
ncbi:MAG: peroxiredoxin [Oligoflexia bacterium]|nr:peroxiredoxin [Oligoflexia bacterium]